MNKESLVEYLMEMDMEGYDEELLLELAMEFSEPDNEEGALD